MQVRILSVLVCTGALALGGPPSALAAGAVFGGSTKAGEPIVIKADRAAAKVKSLVIAWDARCASGNTFSDSAVLRAKTSAPDGLRMSRNRRGRFAGVQTSTAGVNGGDTALMVLTLRGRLKPVRASGVIQTVIKIIDQAGNQVDTCRSGTVPWRASRGAGHVYAGSTSQREPVVVRLDRRRRKATDVLVGWHSASCTPPGFLDFGEHFVNFALSSQGTFGGSFSQSYPMDDGGKSVFAYQLGGRIGARQGHGTFSVHVTATDSTGATTLTCDSAPVSWRVATG